MLVCITGKLFAGQEILARKIAELGYRSIFYEEDLKDYPRDVLLSQDVIKVSSTRDLMSYYHKNWASDLVFILRDIEEWEVLASTAGAILIYVDCPLRTRFEGIIQRSRQSRCHGVLYDGGSFLLPRGVNKYIEFLMSNSDKLDQSLANALKSLYSKEPTLDGFMVLESLYEYCRLEIPESKELGDNYGIRDILRMQHHERDHLAVRSSLKRYSRYVISLEFPDDTRAFTLALSNIKSEIMRLSRPSWDEYFLELSRKVSLRTNCMKRRAGAVLVGNQRIIASGYNGTPKNSINCSTGGCCRCLECAPRGTSLGKCLCMHAEQNALLEIGCGTLRNGTTLYCTTFPCTGCAKILIQSGVKRVVYEDSYSDDLQVIRHMRQCKIDVERLRGQSRHCAMGWQRRLWLISEVDASGRERDGHKNVSHCRG